MNIQFLYFEGCPNHQQAYNQLRDVLRELKSTANVERIVISDDESAQRERFIGSPTIRIDGVDIETVTNGRPYAMSCRMYSVDGKLSGVPSKQMIQDAFWRAIVERVDM